MFNRKIAPRSVVDGEVAFRFPDHHQYLNGSEELRYTPRCSEATRRTKIERAEMKSSGARIPAGPKGNHVHRTEIESVEPQWATEHMTLTRGFFRKQDGFDVAECKDQQGAVGETPMKRRRQDLSVQDGPHSSHLRLGSTCQAGSDIKSMMNVG